MRRVPDAYRPRPILLKGCMIALLSLWVITMIGSSLSDAQSEQDVRTRQVLNVGLPALAAVFAIAWFARTREIRRKGEVFLWIERETWRRGEEITGSIELGFVDPVAHARIRFVRRRDGPAFVGNDLSWSRIANQADGRQQISFRGTVDLDAPQDDMFILEVRTETISGMRTLSGFLLSVQG